MVLNICVYINVNLQNDEKIVISFLVDRFFLQDWDIMNYIL